MAVESVWLSPVSPSGHALTALRRLVPGGLLRLSSGRFSTCTDTVPPGASHGAPAPPARSESPPVPRVGALEPVPSGRFEWNGGGHEMIGRRFTGDSP